MQISIAKDKILDALQHLQAVITTKNTLPILGNVLIETKDNEIILSGTDLQVSLTSRVEADVKKAGATTIPARRLFTICRELPPGEIHLDVDSKDACTIRSGQSYFKILGLPKTDFPALPTLNNARSITLQQAALKDLLRKTAYAISTDETRYVLNGVFVNVREKTITVVATDGRRLALAEIEQEFPKSAECDFILPTKSVNELQRLLKEIGEVKILIEDNQASFEVNNITLYTKLTEGNYPNYRQVIPTDSHERITIEREALNDMVRRVSIMTSEKAASVKFQLEKDSLTLSSSSPDVGEAKETMPIKYSGKNLTIAFNPEYLQDPLRNLTSDEVHIDLMDELSPGVIRTNTPGFLYVIMPMRVA